MGIFLAAELYLSQYHLGSGVCLSRATSLLGSWSYATLSNEISIDKRAPLLRTVQPAKRVDEPLTRLSARRPHVVGVIAPQPLELYSLHVLPEMGTLHSLVVRTYLKCTTASWQRWL